MTDEEIKIANKTARSSGAVGKNALLPRIITGKFPCLSSKILDFGSGPKAMHTKKLREEGYTKVIPFEIGENHIDGVHFSGNMSEREGFFDIVMASNVINTLSSLSAVKETIGMIDFFTNRKGVALINYPTSPRKCKDLDKKKLMELCMSEFNSVMVENHSGTPVFYCYRMNQADWDEEEKNDPRRKELKELES